MTDGDKLAEGELWEEFYTNLHHAYEAMRDAFAKSGLTQDQLAAKLGVDKGLISRRLKGNENLTLRTISFMATAMSCRLRIEPVPYDEVPAPSDDIRARSKPHASAATLGMDSGNLRATETSMAKYFHHHPLNTVPRRFSRDNETHLESSKIGIAEKDLNSGFSMIGRTSVRDLVST